MITSTTQSPNNDICCRCKAISPTWLWSEKIVILLWTTKPLYDACKKSSTNGNLFTNINSNVLQEWCFPRHYHAHTLPHKAFSPLSISDPHISIKHFLPKAVKSRLPSPAAFSHTQAPVFPLFSGLRIRKQSARVLFKSCLHPANVIPLSAGVDADVWRKEDNYRIQTLSLCLCISRERKRVSW